MSTKQPMTEEERAALAKKLDDDLDTFMDSLAEKSEKRKEPFDFDKFMEELDQHPMFMKDLKAGADGQYSDCIQALQAMKYDEDDDEDLKVKAENAKKEGNKHFQLKKYRWAVEAYTNGVKAVCVDSNLNSQLYGNRAAAHRHLGNLRSAIKDCILAWKFNPRNLKAALRGAECLLELGYANKCLRLADEVLRKLDLVEQEERMIEESARKQFDADLEGLVKKAEAKKAEEERNERRKRAEEKKSNQEKKQLLSAFKSRNLRFKPPIDFDDYEHFDMNDITIRSPYTKYVGGSHTDMIKDSHEDLTLGELLEPVFAEPAPWDTDWEYKRENVRLFLPLDVFDDEQLEELTPDQTLREVFSIRDHIVIQGLPVIQIYTKENAKQLKPVWGNRFRPE